MDTAFLYAPITPGAGVLDVSLFASLGAMAIVCAIALVAALGLMAPDVGGARQRAGAELRSVQSRLLRVAHRMMGDQRSIVDG